MSLLALGINHQSAPVALRERVAFAEHALPETLRSLRAMPEVREAALPVSYTHLTLPTTPYV